MRSSVKRFDADKLEKTIYQISSRSQGVIDLLLDCIDRLHQYGSTSHFAETQGEMGEEWETILKHFYELLGEYWWLRFAPS